MDMNDLSVINQWYASRMVRIRMVGWLDAKANTNEFIGLN